MAHPDDQGLREKWMKWLSKQLAAYNEDVADVELGIVRLKVDGAWLAEYIGVPIPDRRILCQTLEKRTYRTT